MASKYIDFDALKQSVTIEQVVEWLGFPLKKMSNGQLRGCCPICDSKNDRSFVVTPAKNLYNCFGGCGGGDIIKLVASYSKIGTREAAAQIQAQFCATEGTVNSEPVQSPSTVTVPPHASPPNAGLEKASELKPLDYLTTDHAAIEALGLSTAACQALGVGFAPKGTMRGRVVFPLRLPDGRLCGYAGLATTGEMKPLMLLPKNLDQMVQAPVQEEKPVQAGDDVRQFLRVVK